MTVGEALLDARRRLHGAHRDSARIDAVRILEAILERDAAWLLAHDRDAISPADVARYDAAIARRERGEPVAYITGTAGFFGRTFHVTPAVLVPRSETEQLAELAIVHLRTLATCTPTVCDIGTGSGILAITIACELPSATCTAIDISASALDIATANAQSLGVADRVTPLLGDLLGPVAPTARFDCIVANLPYIPVADIAPSPDPTSFEPRLALDGGPDGLALYRRLLVTLRSHLTPGATALLEAGPATTLDLAALANKTYPTATVAIHADYAGHPRTVQITP